VAHASEPVDDTGALLGDLFEDSRPSVARDVVIALHVWVAYTGEDRAQLV
jgi:hypothetical protein